MARIFVFVILGLVLSANSSYAAGKVTLENLLRQMTDLSLLAEFPDPPYVTRQFSSYDRASEAPGKESWFANDDHGFMLYDGVVKEKTLYFKSLTGLKAAEGSFAAGTKVGIAPNRKPQGEYVWAYATGPDGGAIDGHIPQGWIPKSSITLDKQGHVLAEMEGPGCVVRIWSPNPQDAGNIRIFLDGADKPVIEAPMETLLAGNGKRTNRVSRRHRRPEFPKHGSPSPIPSPASARAAGTCTSPFLTLSIARFAPISRTAIITSITGHIRKERR